MYENTEKFVDLDFEQKVRVAAYHLWEDEGRPEGRETDYWFRALATLLEKRESLQEGSKSSAHSVFTKVA